MVARITIGVSDRATEARQKYHLLHADNGTAERVSG
jgi:hypothetical protein